MSLTEDLEIKRCGCLISDTGGKEISLRELAEMYHDMGVNGVFTLPSFVFRFAKKKEQEEDEKIG